MKTRILGIGLGWMIFSQLAQGSDPLRTWETYETKANSDLQAIAYGSGLFVAVGARGTIITSPDGANWTPRNTGTVNTLRSVACGGGRFVAVGGDYGTPRPTILASEDGLLWNTVDVDLTNELHGVTYGQGLFVAVGGMGSHTSIILSSSDGFKWDTRLQPDPNDPWDAPLYIAVAYGNGLFMAIDPSSVTMGMVATSPDGITWARRHGTPTSYFASTSFGYGNGLFVLTVGYYYATYDLCQVFTSIDGSEWTKSTEIKTGHGQGFSAMAYGGGQYVAMGGIACRSDDGRKWFALSNPGIGSLCFGNGRFVGVGGRLAFRSGLIGKLEANLLPSSQVEGTITGVARQVYEIQTSTNLQKWSVLTNITITDGKANFSDTFGTNTSQRFYGALLLPPSTNSLDIIPEMVWIKPGTFTMGSKATEQDRVANEGPITSVRLTRGFWIGKYEVTQWEYYTLMGIICPSDSAEDLRHPVVNVTWNEACDYCTKLTAQEYAAGRLPGGYAYRLPTEAEWEYACRAGTTTRFSYGNDPDYSELQDYACYKTTSNHPVGQKKPNAWGLYDMHGNVWEWCLDVYGTYPGMSVTNPTGPSSGVNRVYRGGGAFEEGWSCRSAVRSDMWPDTWNGNIGFRVVLAQGQ